MMKLKLFLKFSLRNFAPWIVVAVLLFPGASLNAATPKVARPNIVLILCDDLGYETLGSYGGTSYKTPNLDKLAASGLRFSRAYCTPLCSPSRVELMTGRYGFHTGWINLIGRGGDEANEYFDPQKEKTFGHVLKQAGYATALAGKWQLAEFLKHPEHVKECGFDEYCCWTWTLEGKRTPRYWDPSIWQDGKLRGDTKGKYGDDVFSDFLIDFIKRHKDRPFFAYYPMCLVHEPHLPTPDSAKERDKQKDKKRKKDSASDHANFPDMMAYMDKTVGKIVAALDQLGLRENTVVIFTGDNGTDRKITSRWNGHDVRGGKGTVTDFGTHVPFIVNWKDTAPSGKVLDNLIDFSDVLPTLAELTGASLPKNVGLDGRSFAPQLRGQKGNPREWIFSQLGHDTLARDSRYLLHKDGRLYDIENDPFEKTNLAANANPEIEAAKKRLQTVLDKLK